MRVMPKLATLIVVVVASLLSAQKMTCSALVFKGQKVEITESGTTPDGVEPKGPAKICLVSSGTCFIPPNSEPQFGFSPEAKIVQLSPKQQALLFTAVASASGSGSLTLLALLDIRNGSLENLLPDVRISEQGEYKIWNEPSISRTALVVTADYLWGDGETHFSRHRFKIRTYAFGTSASRYDLRDEYLTSKKYPSLDEADKITVLEQEKAEILARLRRQK